MADKLEWMNKHLVLLRYISLADVAEKEGYRIRPDMVELFAGETGTEEMVYKLAKADLCQCACELMVYIAHRRAGIWWGYRCVLSLLEELAINPAVERDIADIGANLEVEVPDFAKVKPPEPDPAMIAEMKAKLAEMEAEYQRMRAMVNPEMMRLAEEGAEVAFQEFKKVHGIHPVDLLKKLGERLSENPYGVDPNSPIFQEAAKLKTQLADVQKETVETIKSVIPPKVPSHQKKLRDNALNAVFRWVAAPDAENSQKCLDVGNECPDTPAGLLSLSSFWAYGDLLPLGEQTVATPPGLAANGLNQLLLLCALHQGGTRKVKERYEEYFRLGIEVLTGADNWEAAVASGKAPHEEQGAGASGLEAPPVLPPTTKPAHAAPLAAEDTPPPAYKRWKPEGDASLKQH